MSARWLPRPHGAPPPGGAFTDFYHKLQDTLGGGEHQPRRGSSDGAPPRPRNGWRVGVSRGEAARLTLRTGRLRVLWDVVAQVRLTCRSDCPPRRVPTRVPATHHSICTWTETQIEEHFYGSS